MKSHLHTFASAVALPVTLLAGAAHAQTRAPHEQAAPQNGWDSITHQVSGKHSSAFPAARIQTHTPYGLIAFCHGFTAEQTKHYKENFIDRNRAFNFSSHALRKECAPLSKNVPTSFSIDQSFTEGQANLYTLDVVNRHVNSIPPLSDQANHKVPEYWMYPNGFADCEDYVLLKRYILTYLGEYLRAKQQKGFKQLDRIANLVERGMDANYMDAVVKRLETMGADLSIIARNTITIGALRIATAWDENGEGHAILLGKTHQNRTIALDNKRGTLFLGDLPYTITGVSAAHNVQIFYAP